MNPSRENIQNHQNFSTTTTKSKNQSQHQRTEDKQSPASPEAKPESELTERLIELYNDKMMNGDIAYFFFEQMLENIFFRRYIPNYPIR